MQIWSIMSIFRSTINSLQICHPEAFDEPFTPSEVDAIHAALRREEAAKQSAERGE